MSRPILLDTNLWVYLYDKGESHKSEVASRLFDLKFDRIIVTTQILGELFNVLTRKKIVEEEEAHVIIKEVIEAFRVVAIDTPHVLRALEVRKRYLYRYWDSLIVGSAMVEDCEILYSEDMQDGQIFGDSLILVNPFDSPL